MVFEYFHCLNTLAKAWTTILESGVIYYYGETIYCLGGLRNSECGSCLAGIECVCYSLYIHMVSHLCPEEVHCRVLHRLALTRHAVTQLVDHCCSR